MLMRVFVAKGAAAGSTALLGERGREWPAVWQGDDPAEPGREYDIEVDIDGVARWLPAEPEWSGIAGVNGAVVVSGVVASVDEDVFAVDLEPGLAVVDPVEDMPELRPGQRIRFAATSITVFPSNI